ncbi:sigma-54-dependent transcriptional regulator [Candidatus Latescibacterota bacterium]
MKAHENEIILTSNGIPGACSAAMILLKKSSSEFRITSSRHLPQALKDLSENSYKGTIHICGMANTKPLNQALGSLESLAVDSNIVWYAGEKTSELSKHKKRFPKNCSLLLCDHISDTEAVFRGLELKKSAQVLHLLELVINEKKSQAQLSQEQKFCYDLVHTANRQFFFYGDDSLNEKAIRYLAGYKKRSDELVNAVNLYLESKDAVYPLGSSNGMNKLRTQIGRIGPIPEPVLVQGDTGSGKELVASALHFTSGRHGSYVAVNCAVLGGNPALVEDRLFGHVKGAFTGATKDTKGAFEESDRGTLFLDEVGELPLEVQPQLLRVIEEGKIRPVGTMETRPVDVRIIAATNRNLESMVATKEFREDLYYRLNVVRIHIPPLRERIQDAKSIAAHIGYDLEQKGYPLDLKTDDWEAVENYSWPGNIRQFVNILKRAAYLDVSVKDIIKDERAYTTVKNENHASSESLESFLPRFTKEIIPARDVYRDYLMHALDLFDGNITRTARAVDIAPNTLKKYIVK